MKVLITGGAGFVGANLCRTLLAERHEVLVVDDLSTGYRSNLRGLDLKLHEGSILDADLLDRVFVGVDSVVHLAARGSVPRSIADPMRTNDVNVTGTLTVLQAARAVNAHVIVASSSSVYGSNTASPKHEGLTPQPLSPYAVSKLASESYGVAYKTTFALDTLVFRFFNIFGPLQSARHVYAAVVPCFISALLDGDPLKVYGDGFQSRDFTSVKSVTGILAEAVRRRVTHDHPVNLAFGGNTNLLQLIEHLERLTERTAEIDFLPPRVGDVRASRADNTVLTSLFPGAQAESLEDGLRSALTWFLETGARQS